MSASSPSPLDLQRLLENLLRPGTIAQVDHAAARVRVASGGLLTQWLPWFERRAGDVRTWCPPSVGEQCLLLCPGGNPAAGLVLLGLASDASAPPSDDPHAHVIAYPDGATLTYDHAAHALTAVLPAGGTATLVVPGSVTIDTPQTTITGACTVQGAFTYQAGMTGTGGATLSGTLATDADVVASGISLRTHVHGGVQPGSADTGSSTPRPSPQRRSSTGFAI